MIQFADRDQNSQTTRARSMSGTYSRISCQLNMKGTMSLNTVHDSTSARARRTRRARAFFRFKIRFLRIIVNRNPFLRLAGFRCHDQQKVETIDQHLFKSHVGSGAVMIDENAWIEKRMWLAIKPVIAATF